MLLFDDISSPLVDDWLVNLVDVLLLDNRLEDLMHQRLMVLMQNVLLPLKENVLMVLVDNVLVLLLDNGCVDMGLHNGLLLVLLNDQASTVASILLAFLVSNDNWGSLSGLNDGLLLLVAELVLLVKQVLVLILTKQLVLILKFPIGTPLGLSGLLLSTQSRAVASLLHARLVKVYTGARLLVLGGSLLLF